MANDIDPRDFSNYQSYLDALELAADDIEPEYDEPDLDFMFEHDSAMESVGWGTDEDYGYCDEVL